MMLQVNVKITLCFIIFNFSFQKLCRYVPAYAASAIVTSTSTPGSMLIEVICFTISDGEWRSITLLWILIWNLSQVLEPSPQGVFLVGIFTGPFTFSSFSLAPWIKSAQTFSRDLTVLEVSVILMRWITASSADPPLPSL